MQLKYLFTAEYRDGTSFDQTPEDVSSRDPKRSAFYDLLHSGKAVKRFTLKGEGHTYTVDLSTGEFSCTGPHEWLAQEEAPESTSERRLIYYRQHRHELNRETREELSHTVTYLLGYQITVNDKNYQKLISIR